jgi:hypothetical protein
MTWTRFQVALLLMACALRPPALAAGPGDSPDWSVGLYSEADGEGGLGLAADVTWFATERTQWFLGANYADSGVTLSGLSTRGFELGGRHDFGPVGMAVWYRGWEDPDIIDVAELNGAFELYAGNWTFSLLGAARQSDFEPFDTSTVVTLRNGQQIPITATATCDLDNTGIGLGIDFAEERWSAYVQGMEYSYSDASCGFSSPALELLERTRPAIFRQFASRVTDPLSLSAVTRIGADNALLDTSFSTGVRYDVNRMGYGIDYQYQEEHFDGLEGSTVSGTVSRKMRPKLDIYVTAGMTDGDSVDALWFAGLGVRGMLGD